MTMSAPPHLQIFTSGHATAGRESSFSLFSELPKELRLKIWQHSLQRQRIIHVRLSGPTEQRAAQVAGTNSSTHKSERYRATVDGYQVPSKLLRVNSESREAALEFYRVHLPCTLRRGSVIEEMKAPGILHFNPEYDFLHISPEPPVKDTLVDFIYHLKTTYDLHRVGLLNLAVDLSDLNGNDLYKLESSDLDPDARTAFVDTLMQLREVFFMSIPRAGRQIFGIMSGLPTSETSFNRSFPIMTKTPSFKRLQRDPRPIAEDLKEIFVGTFAPQQTLDLWTGLLKKWKVSPTQIEYRFLLSFEPSESYQIYDRESANRWLQLEDDLWNESSGRSSAKDTSEKKEEKKKGPFSNIKWPVRAPQEKFRNEDLSRAVTPAFGFWLFPIEAVGAWAFPKGRSSESAGNRFQAKQIRDMTKHWPELALMSPS